MIFFLSCWCHQRYFQSPFLSLSLGTGTYRLQPSTGARSHSIIFHRCNFSSFSRQFGRASRGKYPRGLRSPCKINNPYRRFRFSFRSASRVTCLFHFYCDEASSLHRPAYLFFFKLCALLFRSFLNA